MSEGLALPPTPNIVLLHDADHQDRYLPVQKIGLEPPYSVRSFTDHAKGPSLENSGLHQAVTESDVLMIQDCLLAPTTADAYLALCSLGLISHQGYKTRLYVYDEDYESMYLRPSAVRALAEKLWTPRSDV